MKNNLSRREFLKTLGGLSIANLLVNYPLNQIQQKKGKNKPNIIIILFDALSARHMSLYGYHRKTTPNIDRIAQHATVFHRHYTAGNFTTPGAASLLTGTYPWAHRGFHIRGTVASDFETKNLFKLFSNNGYFTTAYSHNPLVNLLLHQFRNYIDQLIPMKKLSLFTDLFIHNQVFNNDNPVALWGERSLSKRGVDLDRTSKPIALYYGLLHQLWCDITFNDIQERYKNLFPRGIPTGGDKEIIFILESAIDWIIDNIPRSQQPLLGYFHLFPPHGPYKTRREYMDIFNDGWYPVSKQKHAFSPGKFSEEALNTQRREYDEYIAYVDVEFARLYNSLEQSGILGNSYLILTSDHGELFERGIRGHITPVHFESLIQIPLVIIKPGQSVRQNIYTPTSGIDLVPTLLSVLGQQKKNWMEGEVLPTFDKHEISESRSIFSVEAKENPKFRSLTKGSVAMIQGQHKFVYYFGYYPNQGKHELYNLVNDPEELNNIYSTKNTFALNMEQLIKDKLHQVNQPYET